MKRTLLTAGISIGVIVGWLAFDPPAPRPVAASSTQPPPAHTGAPPSEGTCHDCHGDNTLNDGNGSVVITGLAGLTEYVPGQTYTVGAVVQHSGQSRWGFEMTVLKDSDNLMAGSFADLSPLTAVQSSGGKSYIGHSTITPGTDGTLTGFPVGTWAFNWTAPAAGAGSITFYVAGNAANNSGTNQGDFIYTNSLTLNEGASTAVEATTWGKIKLLYR